MTAALPVDLAERRARREGRVRPERTESGPVRRGLGLFVVMVVAVVLASLLGVAVAHAQITEQGYELEQIRSTIAEREARVHQLQIEVASLESPTRMQLRANELGLGRSDSIVYLEPSDAVVSSVLGGAR